MRKRLVIGVLRMSVITVLVTLGSDAEAAICTATKSLSTQTCTSWRTTSTGQKYCTSWCTGSEICDTTIYGLGGNILKKCEPGESCPVVTCAAFGTEELGGGDCDPSTLDPDCGIEGIAVCETTGAIQYTLDAVLSGSGDVEDCTKTGKCSKSIQLNAGEPDPNPCGTDAFVTFVAESFNAQSCFCPGGYADEAQTVCCADAGRIGGGCAKPGTKTCIEQRCEVDLHRFEPGDNLPYECGRIPEDEGDDEEDDDN